MPTNTPALTGRNLLSLNLSHMDTMPPQIPSTTMREMYVIWREREDHFTTNFSFCFQNHIYTTSCVIILK